MSNELHRFDDLGGPDEYYEELLAEYGGEVSFDDGEYTGTFCEETGETIRKKAEPTVAKLIRGWYFSSPKGVIHFGHPEWSEEDARRAGGWFCYLCYFSKIPVWHASSLATGYVRSYAAARKVSENVAACRGKKDPV